MSLMGERKMSMHVYPSMLDPESDIGWATSCWSRDFDNRAFFKTEAEATTYAISYLRKYEPGELVVYDADGTVITSRFIELYEDIRASRAPRSRPSGLAERAAA
jgi:hypothetical protein